MAIDKKIQPTENDIVIDQYASSPIDISVEGQPQDNIEMLQDGSAIVGPQTLNMQATFDSNLSEFVDEDDLEKMSSDLIADYETDKETRKDWEQGYTQGLDLLGFKYEERSQPFQGASGVTHPMLAESVTQFQAQAYKELLPAGGPVKCDIVGAVNPQVEEQSKRVRDYMNYQITSVMEEYDPDMDQMLFFLALAGSSFKKVYYDANLGRAVAKFIPVEDLVVPYHSTDLETAPRITHVLKQNKNEVRKSQVNGFYRDVDLESMLPNESAIQEKYNSIEGVSPSDVQYDNECTLLEIHCDLDIPGFEDIGLNGEPTGIKLPYIITIDEGSGKVLSIYRNYKQEDPQKKKIQYFVHYRFLPGLGFYGFGLIHMLGGLSRSATSSLRQLIDAGTLSNLPAGFKARGLRIRDDDSPLQPGEFRDVDAPGGDLRANFVPLPYKEPSQTLFMLLSFCVDAGKRFAAVADAKISDSNNANPVGTTMAMIEQGTKVMSAIHKRMHYAQRVEFRLLARVFQLYLPPEYPYNVSGGERTIKVQDFDERIDIIPVSDPNIFSMSQRIQLAQAQLQLAQSNPQIHNAYEAYRRMYQALGVQNVDAILPPPAKPQPKDPITENAELLMKKTAQSFADQDHVAHINTHRAFISSVLVRTMPDVMVNITSHILQHTSMLAVQNVLEKNKEKIDSLTQQFNGQIPEQVQAAVNKLLNEQIAQVEMELMSQMIAEEQEYLEGGGEDPLVELKKEEIDIEKQRVQADNMAKMAKTELDIAKLQQKSEIDEAKLQQTAELAAKRNNIQMQKINQR
tara:strand:+ start:1431 stop:3821 length:2391 start_codon:yes stop_codon:yes gene_type:complete